MIANRTEKPIAQLVDVKKFVPGRSDLPPIVDGVSVDIPPRGLTILTGFTGSGKSTLFRMLADIDPPDQGRVKLFGHDLSDLTPSGREGLIRNNVGIGFQTSLLDGNFSVLENILLPANAKGKNVTDQRLAHLAIRFGLEDKLEQNADSLSGGEKLRVSLLRAMSLMDQMHPGKRLILLDEPSSAIDPIGKPDMFAYLREAGREASVVAVTHDVEAARQYADHEFVIQSGHLIDSFQYN